MERKIKTKGRLPMTPHPQQEFTARSSELKAIEDYIYSTMNHTPEWRKAESAFQRILSRDKTPSPAAPTKQAYIYGYEDGFNAAKQEAATICNQTLDDVIKSFKMVNEMAECPYVGNEPEDCDADICGRCILEVVTKSLRTPKNSIVGSSASVDDIIGPKNPHLSIPRSKK